jgi:hypothetical protein
MSANRTRLVCVVVSLIVFPNLLRAQQQPGRFIYTSYYDCNPAPPGRINAIVRDKMAPTLDKAVSAKRIAAWGWLTHHTGGSWDRAGYLVAPSVDVLLAAVEELVQEMGDALQELDAICSDHEDYIWEYVGGSQPAAGIVPERPPAGYSTYWECELGREARADTIVTKVFAPIFEPGLRREARLVELVAAPHGREISPSDRHRRSRSQDPTRGPGGDRREPSEAAPGRAA